jgi:hypothetical protein
MRLLHAESDGHEVHTQPYGHDGADQVTRQFEFVHRTARMTVLGAQRNGRTSWMRFYHSYPGRRFLRDHYMSNAHKFRNPESTNTTIFFLPSFPSFLVFLCFFFFCSSLLLLFHFIFSYLLFLLFTYLHIYSILTFLFFSSFSSCLSVFMSPFSPSHFLYFHFLFSSVTVLILQLALDAWNL